MDPNTIFTIHGAHRLWSRTKLSYVDVDELISAGLALPILREPCSYKVHWIVWSEPDSNAIRVVRDEKTKEVVTILNDFYGGKNTIPLIYSRLAYKVSCLRTARYLRAADLQTLQDSGSEIKLKIRCILRNMKTNHAFTVGAGSSIRRLSNFSMPWNDPVLASRLWHNVDPWILRPPSEIIVEYAIVRLADESAYFAALPQTKLQRLLP